MVVQSGTSIHGARRRQGGLPRVVSAASVPDPEDRGR